MLMAPLHSFPNYTKTNTGYTQVLKKIVNVPMLSRTVLPKGRVMENKTY